MSGGPDPSRSQLAFVRTAGLLIVIVAVLIALAGCGESHAHGDPGLVPLADGGHVVAAYNDCNDLTRVAYQKNNPSTDYRLVQAARPEPASTLLSDEVRALDRANWRLFSPTDAGFYGAAIGRTDLHGHDCLLLGRPARILLSEENTAIRPIPKFWGIVRATLKLAQHQTRPLLGLQVYPGPANDPEHRVC